MSVSVTIHPFSDQLVMFDEPDAATSYSLSGYIELCLLPPFALLSRQKPVSLYLHSLALTFEGQCETVSSTSGYNAVRVCSIAQELVTGAPIELHNLGYEDQPCRWRVVFDLNVPGWLPATSPFSSDHELGTRYALYVSAHLTASEGGFGSDWPLLNFCMPWLSGARLASAIHDIRVERVVNAGPTDNSSSSSYLITTVTGPTTTSSDISSQLEVLVSIPKYISVGASEIPFTLRMRRKGFEPGGCKDLRIISIHADFLQVESKGPQRLYHPLLPPMTSQPPNLPLQRPHPIAALYDLGLDHVDGTQSTSHQTHSFLPSWESGNYALTGDNAVYSDDSGSSTSTWLTLDVTVPFVKEKPSSDHTAQHILTTSASHPLFSTQHSLSLSVTGSYTTEDDNLSAEVYRFSIPVRLVRFAPEPLPSYHRTGCDPLKTSPAEAIPCLPPYSQLFHQNGERRTDNLMPPPVYTLLSETAPVDTARMLSSGA